LERQGVSDRSIRKKQREPVHRRYRTRARNAFGPSHLDDLPDDQLLDMRICNLGVHIEGTPVEQRIERLYEELEYRGIRFGLIAGWPKSGFLPTESPESRFPSTWAIPD
jgi:hypothetical protein